MIYRPLKSAAANITVGKCVKNGKQKMVAGGLQSPSLTCKINQ